MAGVNKFFDGHIGNKSKEEVHLNDEKYKGKVIGLYFSAHWCPPCRRFTPILIEFYKKYAKEKKLEIIFLSSDSDEESYDQYYKDMPWLTLDFKEREKKDELSDKFNVAGIPTFILLDGDTGNIICKDARDQMEYKDKKGEDFPWQKSVENSRSDRCIII